jgi:hypothetical protein
MIHTAKLRIPNILGKRMFVNGRDSERTAPLRGKI